MGSTQPREWLWEMNLKLGNKLPRGRGSNISVSILLEGSLQRGYGKKSIDEDKYRKPRYTTLLSNENLYKKTL
jgi:hypothetical protein